MHAFGATRSHQAEMRAEMVVCGGLWMDAAVGLVLHKSTRCPRRRCWAVSFDQLMAMAAVFWWGAASSSPGTRINPGSWSSALLAGRVLVGVICRGAQPGDVEKEDNRDSRRRDIGRTGLDESKVVPLGHEKAVRGIAHRCRSVCQSSGCRRCVWFGGAVSRLRHRRAGLGSVGEGKKKIPPFARLDAVSLSMLLPPMTRNGRQATGRNDALNFEC